MRKRKRARISLGFLDFIAEVCFVEEELWGNQRMSLRNVEFERTVRRASEAVLIGYMVGSWQEFQREAQSPELRDYD